MLPLRRERRKREGASTVSLNHPLAAILTEARRKNAQTAVSIHDAVRLVPGGSGLCPNIGRWAGTGHGLVAIAAGLGMGTRRRTLRPRPGPGNRFGYGSAGPQSWSARRHPATAHPRPGVYGVALPVHAGHHFPQGQLLSNGSTHREAGEIRPDPLISFCFRLLYP